MTPNHHREHTEQTLYRNEGHHININAKRRRRPLSAHRQIKFLPRRRHRFSRFFFRFAFGSSGAVFGDAALCHQASSKAHMFFTFHFCLTSRRSRVDWKWYRNAQENA